MSAAAAKRRPRHSANGIELPRTDGRTIAARRFCSLIDAYAAELGGNLTEPQKALVKQVSSLQLRIEQLQSDIVEGRDVDPDQVIRLSSEHRRLLNSLRTKSAKSKPANVLTPLEYAQRKAAEKAASALEGDAA